MYAPAINIMMRMDAMPGRDGRKLAGDEQGSRPRSHHLRREQQPRLTGACRSFLVSATTTSAISKAGATDEMPQHSNFAFYRLPPTPPVLPFLSNHHTPPPHHHILPSPPQSRKNQPLSTSFTSKNTFVRKFSPNSISNHHSSTSTSSPGSHSA